MEKNIKQKILQENIKVHQREAAIYDDFHIEIYNKYENQQTNADIDYIKNLLKKKRRVRLLDLGCGTGNIALRFQDEKYDITGLDLSAEMLEKFKRKSNKKIKLICRDVEEFLAQNKETYDLVVISSVLHHLHDPYKIFEKVLKIIDKNGVVYLTHEPLYKKQQRKNIFSNLIDVIDKIFANLYWLYKFRKKISIDHSCADYHSSTGIDTGRIKNLLENDFRVHKYQEYSAKRLAITSFIDNKIIKTKIAFKLIAQK